MLALEKELLPIWVEIDLKALENNLHVIRTLIPAKTKIMGVVKFNAYGHGVVKAARVLTDNGIDALGVANAEEGIELRNAGINIPIIILANSLPESAGEIIRYNLTPMVCSLEFAAALDRQCQRAQKRQKIHLRVDTSDGGIGVRPEHFSSFAREISKRTHLHIEGIFTHLLSTYLGDRNALEKELKQFKQAIADLKEAGYHDLVIHAHSSPGVFRFPESIFSLVRVGTSLYGLPSYQDQDLTGLQPVMQLKSRIIHICHNNKEKHMEYTEIKMIRNNSSTALVPVGYGDLPYLLSMKNGSVLVNGEKAPVLGNAFMGHVLIDITHLPNVRMGDEVVIIGSQSGQMITAAEVAANCGFHVEKCESVCLLDRRIKRLYID